MEADMKKHWVVLLWLFCVARVWGGAVPSQITYQGTLKQSGAAANGTYSMVFRLTDSTGLNQYWSSGPQNVSVNQGLFSMVLSPTGVDWQNVAPHIEVNVSGQTLLPREPVNSTAYALMCGSVADGSVFAGMIAMFAGACPTGWTVYAPLEGRFPVGQDPNNPAQFALGASGGQLTHAHGISSDGAHDHDGWTGGPNRQIESDGGRNFVSPIGEHTHSISTDGDHNHTGTTATVSSLPPYLSMVFCQKL